MCARPGKGRERRIAFALRQWTGEREMEHEILEHIGITPSVEMFGLPLRQAGRDALRPVVIRKRRAEGIEFRDAGIGQFQHARFGIGRREEDKAAGKFRLQRDVMYGRAGSGEPEHGGEQLVLGRAIVKRERRLQGGVETVTAWGCGEGRPFVGRELRRHFPRNILAGLGITAEHEIAELPEAGAALGRRINGVARHRLRTPFARRR